MMSMIWVEVAVTLIVGADDWLALVTEVPPVRLERSPSWARGAAGVLGRTGDYERGPSRLARVRL